MPEMRTSGVRQESAKLAKTLRFPVENAQIIGSVLQTFYACAGAHIYVCVPVYQCTNYIYG
jgi:hypothetical protein